MTPIALALACLLAVTLSYALVCAVSPFTTCRACKGFGFKTRTTRTGAIKRGRDCRRCHATGRRLRIGRRLHNHSVAARESGRRIRHDAH
ncbi:hypothetical protein AB0D08_32745 [Kitasatospora sp. NPDC048540]|uniref:hypothetical protein n=1 Tax=Kitasatospora sp. NPDC048540 TaxID=3155634 RepID=UPI00340E1365